MKVETPLQSLEASGMVGPRITFSKRKSDQQVRFQRKQKDAKSNSQITQRQKFLNASLSCRYMAYGEAFFGISFFAASAERNNAEAVGKEMSGYNVCISENINLV